MRKRIFVGIDFFASNFYLVGLSTQFEFLFYKSFSLDERSAMQVFLSALKNPYLVYRIPYFSCHFQRFTYVTQQSVRDIDSMTSKSSYRHAVFPLGFDANAFQYQVAYIDEIIYQEQLEILGNLATKLNLVEIDFNALWLLRWWEKPTLGAAKAIKFNRSNQSNLLYGFEANFWPNSSPIKVSILDEIPENPWYIAKSLAVRGYYHVV